MSCIAHQILNKRVSQCMDEYECGWSRRKVKKTVAFMTWNQSIVWCVFICTDSPADEQPLNDNVGV